MSAGVNFASDLMTTPASNDRGQVAFAAQISGDGIDATNNAGIWLGEPGRSISPFGEEIAPDVDGGLRFAGIGPPVLNNAGQIAFRGSLMGSGINEFNNDGIWATDNDGMVRLIAREGTPLEVAPGDLRTPSAAS